MESSVKSVKTEISQYEIQMIAVERTHVVPLCFINAL
jgi:hypothetical protein